MGLFTALASLSGLVFTFAGGVLCGIDWRYTFLLLPVVTSLALLVTPMVLPKIPPTKGGALDVPGQVLLAVGVTALLYGSSELANSLTSLKTLGPIVAGIALLGGFFLREALAKHHFFPVSIFRSPVFLAALCAGFIYNFGTAVSFLQVTNLWQYITGLNATKVSIWQLPMLLSGIAAGLVTGRLIGKRISNRVAILGGSVLFLIGSVLLSLANTSKDFVAFLPGLVIGGAGVVVAAVPYGSLILREAPAGFVGPVTSARTTVGQIFYTLGFALSMVSIDRLTNTGVISRLKADGVSPTSYGTGLDAIRVYASTSQKPTSTVGQEALQGAAGSYGDAFSVTMIGAGVIATIVGIVAFVLLSNGRDNEPAAAKPVAASVPTPATS
jgi:predicted MFS family arabinose efflux permease